MASESVALSESVKRCLCGIPTGDGGFGMGGLGGMGGMAGMGGKDFFI
jgi:hypothetical protein